MSTPVQIDVNGIELARLASDLGASEEQVRLAFKRALQRTSRTLHTRARRGLKNELQLRNQRLIRRRMKKARLRRKAGGGFQIWFGANDMPVSEFKGRPKTVPGGASFRGQEFPGGFIRKGASGKRTIFQRVRNPRYPIAEAKLSVADDINKFVEGRVWSEALDIFWHNFRRDLRARTIYGVG